MSLTVAELVTYLRLDKTQFTRGVAGAKTEAASGGKAAGQAFKAGVLSESEIRAAVQAKVHSAALAAEVEARTGGQKTGNALASGITGAVGKLGGLAAAGVLVKKAFDIGSDFTTQLNTLQAVTQASGQTMTKVAQEARDLGNATDIPATSARDAAAAMTELAKGGLSVQDSMTAARGTLMLAAAAQVDGAKAAQIQAAALNTFGLSADQANHVADVLANTANAASGEITDFAQGLAQSGSVAKLFGISIEDTATFLGIFAKNGMLGSDAGTSLKTMLTQLANPTKESQAAMEKLGIVAYDNQGKFVGLRSITEQLSEAKKKLTQQDFSQAAATVFGTDALRAASQAAEGGVQQFDSLEQQISKTGGASQVAGAQMQGWPGALQKAQSAAEDFGIQLTDRLGPAVGDLADTASQALPHIADVAGPVLSTVAGAISLVVKVGGELADMFDSLPGPVKVFALALTAISVARAVGVFDAMKRGAGALLSPLQSARMQLATTIELAATSGTKVNLMSAGFRAAGAAAAGFGRSLMAALGGPWGVVIAAASAALSLFVGKSDDATRATVDFSGALDENTGSLKANASATIADTVKESLAAWQAAGGSVDDYTQALTGNRAAQASVEATMQSLRKRAIEGSHAWQEFGDKATAGGVSLDDVAAAMGRGDRSLNSLYQRLRDAGLSSKEFATFQVYAENSLKRVDEISGDYNNNLADMAKALAETTAAADSKAAAQQREADATATAAGAQERYVDSLIAAADRGKASQAEAGTAAQVAAGQQERYVASLEAAGRAVDAAGGPLPQYRTKVGEAATGTDLFATKLHDASSAADTADKSLQGFLTSIELLVNPQKAQQDWAADYAEKLRSVAKAQRDQAASTDGVADAQARLTEARAKETGAGYDPAQKARDVAAAERAVADAKDQSAESEQRIVDSADAVRESRSKQIDQVYRTTLATKGEAAAVKAAAAEADRQSASLVKNHDQYGLTEKAAKDLNKTVGLTPKNVKTTYESNAKEAAKNGLEVYRAYDSASKTWTANFMTEGDAEAARKAGDLVQKYDKATGTWTGNLDATTDDAQGKIDAFVSRNNGRVITVNVNYQATQGAAGSGVGNAPGIYTGGLLTAGGIRRFAGGGMPWSGAPTPGSLGDDNLVALGPDGRPMKFRGDEFIVNPTSTKKHLKLLWMINQNLDIPGLAGGGAVGAAALAGHAARQMGTRESITVGSLADVMSWIKALGEQWKSVASDATDAARKARQAEADGRRVAADQRAKVAKVTRDNADRAADAEKRLAAARTAAAKAAAESGLAKVQRENTQRLNDATAAQTKANRAAAEKTSTAQREAAASAKAAAEAKARYTNESQLNGKIRDARTMLVGLTRDYDANTAKAGKLRDKIDNLVSQRTEMASGIMSKVANIGGGIFGSPDFQGTATTTGDIISALRKGNAAGVSFQKQVNAAAAKGIDPKVLAQLAADESGRGDMILAAIAGGSKGDAATINQLLKARAGTGQATGLRIGDLNFGKDIKAAQGQLDDTNRVIRLENDAIDRIARSIAAAQRTALAGTKFSFTVAGKTVEGVIKDVAKSEIRTQVRQAMSVR